MAYTPAYEKPWKAVILTRDGKKLKNELTPGPIFPLFTSWDFETYEGFRDFTDRVGLNGFTYLEKREEWEDGLDMLSDIIKRKYWPPDLSGEMELFKRGNKKGNKKTIPDSYVREFYDCIKGGLLEEQKNMALVYSMLREKGTKLPSRRVQIKAIRALQHHLSLIKVKMETSSLLVATLRGKTLPQRIDWTFSFGSLPAHCYLEILDVIQDDKKIKDCANCKVPFISSYKKEINCNRLAPGHRTPGKERICKQIGPQKQFRDGDGAKQKKEIRNRFDYLTGRRKGFSRKESAKLIRKDPYYASIIKKSKMEKKVDAWALRDGRVKSRGIPAR